MQRRYCVVRSTLTRTAQQGDSPSSDVSSPLNILDALVFDPLGQTQGIRILIGVAAAGVTFFSQGKK